MYQWNINIQRELFRSTTLTVGYVGSRGLHLYAARDINPVEPTVVNGVTGLWRSPRPNRRRHHQQPAPQSGGRGVEQRGAGRRLELQLAAGGIEPALLARCAVSAFVHLVEVHGRRLRHVWAGRRHSVVRPAERFLRPRTLPVRPSAGFEVERSLCPAVQSEYFRQRMADERRSYGAERIAVERDRRIRSEPETRLPASSGPTWCCRRARSITGNVTQWANPAAFSLPAPGTLGNLQRDFLPGPGIVDSRLSRS